MLLLAPLPAPAVHPAAAAPGELLVRLAPAASPLPLLPLGPTAGVTADTVLAPLSLQLVRVPSGSEAASAGALRALPGVLSVEPNHRVQAAGIPNDPYFAEYQWNLRQIHAPEAWDLTTGDRRVIIAILDTGIALDHPDLQEKLVPGLNLVTPTAPPADDNGHGTHVAGIAAATSNNGIGVAGVSWETRLMPVKVLDQAGSGDVNRVAQGIVWAVEQGARVVNLSFTGTEPSAALTDAVAYARGKGALVVAAVGNDGRPEPTYPAATEGVTAVAATDRNDRRVPASNYGSYVSVSAPGQEIPSTFWDPTVGNTYALSSTTSQAAPHVSGLAGLIWSVNPDLSGDAVRALIENHADDAGAPGRDDETGAGRINAYRSVLAAVPWNYDSGGASAYRAPLDSAPRLFLPYLVKGVDGWTSALTVRNASAQPVSVTVTFIAASGAAVTSVGASLNGYGATTLPLQLLSEVPSGFLGSAVVDTQGRISAIVHQDRPGGDRHGYAAVASGAARLYAPQVQKNSRNGATVLYLQDAGETREVATITYYAAAGLLTAQETVTVSPRTSTAVRLADSQALPADFSGAAVVESATGGPLVGVAVQQDPAGGATAYNLPSEGGQALAAPLIFRNARGWSTSVQLFNGGATPASVSATYSRAAAGSSAAAGNPPQDVVSVPPRGTALLAQPTAAALPDNYVGSAVLSSVSNGPLVALVNETRPDVRATMTYLAAPSGASVLDIPLVTKDYGGWTSGLRIQNLAGDPAEITIVYYAQTGRTVYTAQDTLAPGTGNTYALGDLAALPWGFVGSATVTSNGRPLAAVVNQLKLSP